MTDARVSQALAWLESKGSTTRREEFGTRYGIVTPRAFGVAMGDVQALGKRLGRDHALAAELWATGWYEARLLAAYVDEPDKVTAAQMDRWAKDFDNWGLCDTLCFALFDRTPHAWRKVEQWGGRREEFVKRAGFALLASLGVHDKKTGDEPFARLLPLIEQGAADDRNFVKKGVSWALRVIGRRSAALNEASLAVAERLAASSHAGARWVGKDARRELSGPVVRRVLAKRAAAAKRVAAKGAAKRGGAPKGAAKKAPSSRGTAARGTAARGTAARGTAAKAAGSSTKTATKGSAAKGNRARAASTSPRSRQVSP